MQYKFRLAVTRCREGKRRIKALLLIHVVSPFLHVSMVRQNL